MVKKDQSLNPDDKVICFQTELIVVSIIPIQMIDCLKS